MPALSVLSNPASTIGMDMDEYARVNLSPERRSLEDALNAAMLDNEITSISADDVAKTMGNLKEKALGNLAKIEENLEAGRRHFAAFEIAATQQLTEQRSIVTMVEAALDSVTPKQKTVPAPRQKRKSVPTPGVDQPLKIG